MNKYLSLLSIVLASTLISTSNASSLINPKSSLFNKVKRQTTGTSQNGMPYPAPGGDPPSQDTLPQSWIDAYNKAKSEGKIPDIKPSTAPGGIVEYPADQDMTNVCSWTTQKCDTGDIWLAPPGKAGLSFDDGPNLGTEELLKYLDENDLSGTHFVIGSAILYNPDTMKLMADSGVHLGVHTFSHSIQTTKTDLEVLGDLGWNMQLIYEATGKVPMYFRPPEGDVDNRVRAIARDVLGLQTVMWNEDADDWCLRQGSGTAQLQTCLTGTGKDYQSVVNEMKSWADNDKSSGFISLEHETTDQAVNAFKEYATELKNKGWNVTEIPGLQDLPWYQNQFGKDDPVTQVDSILPTIPAINIVDSAAAPGTSGAPDASAFRSGNGGGSSSSSSSSVGSSTSASSTASSASQTSSTTTRATTPTSNNNNNDTSGAVALSSFNLVALGVASFVASYLL